MSERILNSEVVQQFAAPGYFGPLACGDGQRPCIVMAHGLGGTRDAGLQPYAEKFANAGYLVLLFDYRHFGGSGGEPRQLFSIRRQLQDWASAIGYARSGDGVDPKRIALWRTSFSGGHVIVAAAKDKRIVAVSAQCPMMDAFAASLNVIRYAGLAAFLKLCVFGMVDQLRAIFRTSPLYIPLIALPGTLAAEPRFGLGIRSNCAAPLAEPDLRAICFDHRRLSAHRLCQPAGFVA